MYKFIPQILGLVDKLNDLNDKFNDFAGKYLDNVGAGTLILGILIVVAFWGIRTLNKNN